MQNEPLGLPKGTVRGVIALSVTLGTLVLFALGRIESVEQFVLANTGIWAFYYMSRK